jgi:hypothetical protein
VQEYRHTAVGIRREVVGERFAARYCTEIARGGGGAAEEGRGSSDEKGEDLVKLQSRRTTTIGTVA